MRHRSKPRSHALLAFAIATALLGAGLHPQTARAATVTQTAESKAQQLNRLYAEYWEETLELNPIQATFQGDARYNDRMPDFYSAAFRAEAVAFTERWLKRIEAIGPQGLSGQDLLSYEIFVEDARDALESEKFPSWMLPVNQMGSLVTYAAMLGSGTSAQPFKTVKDYENWLARGNRMPVLVDSMIGNMRDGMKAGVVQPRALMVKVVPQIDALVKDAPEETLFWGPIKAMPAEFSEADKTRLSAAYRDMIGRQVMPSFRKLRTFIADEYLPATRDSVGMDKLPGGAAWYAFNVRQSTTRSASMKSRASTARSGRSWPRSVSRVRCRTSSSSCARTSASSTRPKRRCSSTTAAWKRKSTAASANSSR
jgi:uncharacterized protein (DUF885 family)